MGRPPQHLHSVIVSYNRQPLTQQAIETYLATVTLPYSLVVVDNASDEATCEWLLNHSIDNEYELILLPENRYPGYATNRGWERMRAQTTLLHRGDNDFAFVSGWCDEVMARFAENERLGQLGLRTDEEELHNGHNVGGNNVIRRELWDAGLRYDERSWPQISKKVPGYTEDSFMSPKVLGMGWEWGRVRKPCIRSLSNELPGDPDFDSGYYSRTWADRGIER